jgi:putative GTP pyrophosphokinase
MERLFNGSGVSVSQLESRTKTVESFTEKIARKSKYVDPLNEITDLSGLRVIVHDAAHIPRAGKLIGDQFAIDEKNSVSRGADIEPDRFGYRAEHYVIQLKPEQIALPAWSKFAGFTAEVQVRTVMQHAWAAVDHKIRYKGENLPRPLERRLFRLNALLDLADEQFADLQRRSTEVSESYARSMEEGDLDVDLDALSLLAYLDKTRLDHRWAEIALRLGYKKPVVDRMEAASVLETMRAVGIRSLGRFEEVFASAESWGELALQNILDQTRGESAPGDEFAEIVAYRDELLCLLMLFEARSEEAIEASGFRVDIQDGLCRAIAG